MRIGAHAERDQARSRRSALLRRLALLWGLLLVLPVAAEPHYRVGVEMLDYAPYGYLDNGEYRGINRELLDAFAAHQGIVFDYVALPYIRSVKELQAGNLDFQFPDDPAWLPGGRVKQLYFSDPALAYIDGASVLPERLGQPLENLSSLGTIIGFTPTGYFPRIVTGELELQEQAHVQGLVDQALRRRVDGIYLSVAVVEHALKQRGQEGALRFDPDLPHHTAYYRLSSLKHPELIRAFDRFVHSHHAWLQALQEAHGIMLEGPARDSLCVADECRVQP